MGYEHRAIKTKCGKCGHGVYWRWTGGAKAPWKWRCDNCGTSQTLCAPPEWPNIPHSLFVGQDQHTLLKVYAMPPEQPDEEWASPYSIRSFVAQASRTFGGCYYSTSKRGVVMGQTVFSDGCSHDLSAWEERVTACHILSGWGAGEAECPLWNSIAALCQTDEERRFLYKYLQYAKDRHFPMLIPQARIGIAERRRPDFVMFLPLQYWKFQWLAIELDGGHPPTAEGSDAARDAELAAHGYDVFRVRPAERGYFEEVRRLVERVESRMALFESEPLKIAVEVKIDMILPPPPDVDLDDDDLPF